MQDMSWEPIPAAGVADWNRRLLATNASLHQYPFWNEPYRRVRCTPHYLAYGPPEAPAAYACVLGLGVPGMRIGLVHLGPVLLEENVPIVDLTAGLVSWARRSGIAFLRFTHTDGALLDVVAGVGRSERVDSFPFHRGDPKWDLVVSLPQDQEELGASFRKDARREIRRDQRRGYAVRSDSAPEALAAVWPMFEAHSRRRGFRHNRPLAWWLDVMRHARPYGCAQLYVASLAGRPVAADLYVRDRTRVRSITAWDEDALRGDPTPSTFLIWHAMCDLQRLGIREYTLGPSSGSLYAYKQRFHPRRQVHPEPVTLIVREPAYRLWKATALRAGASWPRWSRARLVRQTESGGARLA